jgi:beta-xylosidase
MNSSVVVRRISHLIISQLTRFRHPLLPSLLVFTMTPWIPARDDGTYQNPVLFADYSDPDVARVGDDYWLTASSFSHVPGLPILHSRDLVNWTIVNHALPRLVPADHFATPRHGCGVWAPAIRYHAGKYWIYYPDPDFGIYVVTASDPQGKWSDPILVRGGKGLIDPCPFWDDDGRVHLIHAWARSRAGIANRLTLCQLSSDGQKAIDEGTVVIDGDKLPGWRTIEGPKLYKRGGYYYIFAPAGGVAEGYQAVFRSRDLHGPYENRIVLAQGNTPINGPHQGAWVDTPAGEHWFLHFQDRGPYGRVVHLQPMIWRDDWPVMGGNPDGGGEGQPVMRHQKPALPPQPVTAPVCSDDFHGDALGLQWQWQANPPAGWASLTIKPGALRLTSVPAPDGANFWLAPNLLMQKFPAPAFTVTAKLEFAPRAGGERAGLLVFGYSYAWIGLRQTAQGLRLVQAVCENAHEGGAEREIATVAAPPAAVHLRVMVDAQATCAFAYSLDGLTFQSIGERFQATPSRWVGAKVGLFALSPPAAPISGHADFDWFRVESAP